MSDEKRHQIVALGRVGWILRRIEDNTGGLPGEGDRIPEGRSDTGAPASGMSATPETRIVQAQAGPLASLDLVSALVHDELQGPRSLPSRWCRTRHPT